MEIVKAPGEFASKPRPWVFLAGSIEMGTAVNWQEQLTELLANYRGTILNPRRDAWDSSWVQDIKNPQFKEQVDWELDALRTSDHILMYFDPETKSPITLLELGLSARSGKLFVACPPGFWRRGNVQIVCQRMGIPLFEDWDSLFLGYCSALCDSY